MQTRGFTTGKSGKVHRFKPGDVIEAEADEFGHLATGSYLVRPLKAERSDEAEPEAKAPAPKKTTPRKAAK